MPYVFGNASLAQLCTVHPDLQRVCNHALAISAVDFGVGEGARSDAEQLRDWQRHASKLNGIPVGTAVNGVVGTGRGNHQVAADGFGRAVDLVPYVGGVILWSLPPAQQWQHIYPMAEAMRAAAVAEGVSMRWGAVWDRLLNMLPAGALALESEVVAYARRHAGPDLLDGPHFELHA